MFRCHGWVEVSQSSFFVSLVWTFIPWWHEIFGIILAQKMKRGLLDSRTWHAGPDKGGHWEVVEA